MSEAAGCGVLREHLRGAEAFDPLPEEIARHLETCGICSALWNQRRRLHETLERGTAADDPRVTEEQRREQWRRILRSLAPGWILRCFSCGRSRPFGEAGGIRLGAWGTKVTLVWCSECRGLRIGVIERTEDPDGD